MTTWTIHASRSYFGKGQVLKAPTARFIPAQGKALGWDRLIREGLKGPTQAELMSQSLSLVILHIVFSTKDRRPSISEDICPRLHAYLATVARDQDCECFCAGGVADHVHLAVRLSRMKTIAGLVEKLKTSSSKWLKEQFPELRLFAWQSGYAAFSVSPGNLEALRRYISQQEEHHKGRDFQEEMRVLFSQYGVEFDERYLWD